MGASEQLARMTIEFRRRRALQDQVNIHPGAFICRYNAKCPNSSKITPPNCCTRVELYLPRALQAAVDLDTPAAETPRGQGETILVLEDDATVRLVLSDVLGELALAPSVGKILAPSSDVNRASASGASGTRCSRPDPMRSTGTIQIR